MMLFYNIDLFESFNTNENNLFMNIKKIPFDLQSYGSCSSGSYPNQNYRWYNSSSDFKDYQCNNIAKQSNIKWLGNKNSISLPYGCLLSNNQHYGTGIMFNNERTNVRCGLSFNDWGSVNCLCNKRKLNL